MGKVLLHHVGVTPVKPRLIKCDDIAYRQGFIEVALVHPQSVNVEVWNVHPERDISGMSRVDSSISDAEIVGNTEIELNASQAHELIRALELAIDSAGPNEAQTRAASPKVGVGVIVVRDAKVLLGLRQGSHGAGTWALPGGHLEFGETVETCAVREVLEETGLVIDQVRAGPFTNDVMAAEGKHYVTLFVIADNAVGEPEVREPAKCRRWAWFDWSDLPKPLFQPLHTLKRSGFQP
jgi:8-oxo-dGTP diphosphatase